MAELKSSSRSHKTDTFRGATWAEETILLLPLCHVTIMCNEDKWLTLLKKNLLLLARRHKSKQRWVFWRYAALRLDDVTRAAFAEESSQAKNENVRWGSEVPRSAFQLMALLQLRL